MQSEIGNWRLGEVLGEGGMGTVYLARHRTLGTQAAFKVLSPGLTRGPKLRERFVREAQAQAQLRHPAIAQVFDFIEQGDDLCMVVEYLPGGSLADVLEREKKPLPLSQAIAWARQALTALDFAHQKGVIHRDVKPSNILFDEKGQPKIVDFGIALVLDSRRLTTTGVLGTPQYMSPEQIRRPHDVDHRTDVYAMGVVLYEMLAGRPPFDGESDFDIRQAQVSEPPKALRPLHPEVGEDLEAIVLRALAKQPDERFSGCGEMERALGALGEAGEAGNEALAAPQAAPSPGASSVPPRSPEPAAPNLWADTARVVLGVVALCIILLVIMMIAQKPSPEGQEAEAEGPPAATAETPAAEAATTEASEPTGSPVGTTIVLQPPVVTTPALPRPPLAVPEKVAAYEGRLAAGEEFSHFVVLLTGYEYSFAGSCDSNCRDLDLSLVRKQTTLASDQTVGATPGFKFIPSTFGFYDLHARMVQCAEQQCGFSVTVTSRRLEPQSPTPTPSELGTE